MTNCQVKSCNDAADFKITYDCGDADQIISVCKKHYESYDIEDGEKFYYFKKFVKNIEILNC